MRHARFVFVVSLVSLVPAALEAGCGSGSHVDGSGTDNPTGDGGHDIGNPADGSAGDSGGGGGGGGGSCTDAGPADDRKACNDCAYANCCKQIDDCAADFNCGAIAACEQDAGNDQFNLLLCQDEYDPTTAQALGACAQAKCGTECPPPPTPDFDAGI